MTDLDPFELAVQLAESFDPAGVRYILGGSLTITALGVLKAQRDRLDRAQLARWAQEVRVVDLLETAIEQAGLSRA